MRKLYFAGCVIAAACLGGCTKTNGKRFPLLMVPSRKMRSVLDNVYETVPVVRPSVFWT